MVSMAFESISLHPSGRIESEISVSVTLTCQMILPRRFCAAAGGAARTLRAYRGRVGGGYRVSPRTASCRSVPNPRELRGSALREQLQTRSARGECQFQRRALDSASVTAPLWHCLRDRGSQCRDGPRRGTESPSSE